MGAAKSGNERVSQEFEGGHGPCGDLKVVEAVDHQREASAREFIFPVRPVRRCHRDRPAARAAGCSRLDRPAAELVCGYANRTVPPSMPTQS
jgi:hypothetical protein